MRLFCSGVPFREHRETAQEPPLLETRTFLLGSDLGNAPAALRDHGSCLRPDVQQLQKLVESILSTFYVWCLLHVKSKEGNHNAVRVKK